RGQRNLRLTERACVHPTEVLSVLNTLSSTLIFNNANQEERIALASRLRHWVVDDGTYLIREGDGDSIPPAIFMIASGKATISLNRKLENGSIQEVDIKDIRYPNYFGEGRVLADQCAYASVRAKQQLVVYYIMRADIEELVSPKTRALMLRDMEIRMFQKSNVDDLFGVIRDSPSGMECLTRFAREQRMDGDVVFFNDVEEYKRTPHDPEERKARAQRIFDDYISPSSGGAMMIYTSEAQRKAIAAGMKHIWGKSKNKRKSDESSIHRRQISGIFSWRHGGETGDCETAAGRSSGNAKTQPRRCGGVSSDGDDGEEKRRSDSQQHPERGGGAVRKVEEDDNDDEDERGQQSVSGRRNPPDFATNDGGVHGVPENDCDGDRGGVDGSDKSAQREEQDPDASDGVGMDGENPKEAADLERALSLFDEVLDQNAIPTIRQHIIPKFLQSTYYELFLAKRFPLLSDTGKDVNNADSRISVSELLDENTVRQRFFTTDNALGERSVSDVNMVRARHHSESAATAVAAAVTAAAATAGEGGEIGEGGRLSVGVGGIINSQNARPQNRQSWSGKYGKPSGSAVDYGMGLNSGLASPISEHPIKSGEVKTGKQLRRAE
ncbi:unnamed protein product, partial [Sphacelaria rigidula]